MVSNFIIFNWLPPITNTQGNEYGINKVLILFEWVDLIKTPSYMQIER